jgi:hypothetical protein
MLAQGALRLGRMPRLMVSRCTTSMNARPDIACAAGRLRGHVASRGRRHAADDDDIGRSVMKKRLMMALAMGALMAVSLPGVASADHGDAYKNDKSGRCIAVPEMAGSRGGRGNAEDSPGRVPFRHGEDNQGPGSTCDGGDDGTQPPYGEENPFPKCSEIPGLRDHAEKWAGDCGEG